MPFQLFRSPTNHPPLSFFLVIFLFSCLLSTNSASSVNCKPCTTTSKCNNGQTCVNNKCVKHATPYSSCSFHNPCTVCPPNFVCARDHKCRPVSCGSCRRSLHCPRGQLCFKGVCKTTKSAGEKCSAKCDGCKRGLSCFHGRCQRRHPQRNCDECTGHNDCKSNYRCIKRRGRRYGQCMKFVAESRRCDFKCGRCKHGFYCSANGRCAKIKAQRCAACGKDDDCLPIFVCKKQPGKKRGKCAKPMKEGQSCQDPCWGCAKGLVCGNNLKCQRELSRRCGPCSNDDNCQSQLVCKKDKGKEKGKCAKPMKEGQSCKDPCWGCAPGLICNENRKCSKVRNGHCGQCTEDDNCQSPLVCKKGDGNTMGRCAKPMKEGQSCEDPCWGCAKGLECGRDKRCHRGRNPLCGACKEDKHCQSPLVCNKKEGQAEGTCAKPMKEGQSCEDPCWGCAHGLYCGPDKKCKRRRHPVCAKCSSDDECESDLRCKVGKDGTRRCATRQGVGAPCSHNCIICRDGLRCSPDGKCTEPPKGPCEKCYRDYDCKEGLQCVRAGASVGRCSKVTSLGQECGQHCTDCRIPYLCDKKSGKCKAGKCQGCGSNADCMYGHKCAKQKDGELKCTQIVHKNSKCGQDCVDCNQGLQCVNGYCNKPKKPICEACARTDECESGLHCTADSSGKTTCQMLLDIDQSCGQKCSTCKKDLVCREGGKCRKPKRERCETCRTDAECEEGLSCRPGHHGRKRCSIKVQEGATCKEGCRYCSSGLECTSSGRCELPKSEKCEKCRNDRDCEKGLKCRPDANGNKKCFAAAIIDEDCKSECHFCDGNLVCGSNGKCEKPKAEKCESCERDSDCESGLNCIRTSKTTKRCSVPTKLGSDCQKECHFCTGDLICGLGGRCEKPKRKKCQTCNDDGECDSGLECKLHSDRIHRCSVPVALGSICQKDCHFCTNGLVCGKTGKCEEEKKKTCEFCSKNSDCEEALRCKESPDGKKRCSSPVALGKGCLKQCHFCIRNLVCGDSGTCEKPKLSKCQKCRKDNDCESNLQCRKGQDGITRCTQTIQKGGNCKEKCHKCAEGLVCDKVGRCITKKRNRCEECSTHHDCESGLKCQKNSDGKQKCFQPIPNGGNCAAECHYCINNLVCGSNGRCRPPRQDKCGECKSNNDCKEGLVCISGSDGKSKCSVIVKQGGECRSSCHSCSSGFVCGKDGKCRTPPKDICEKCIGDDDCKDSFKCRKGKDGQSRCSSLVENGKNCDETCHFCKGKQICNTNGKCENPKSKICENCKSTVDCESGLKCRDVEGGNLQCIQTVNDQESCKEPCHVCTSGLICGKNGICHKPPGNECESCKRDADCRSDLQCKESNNGKLRCTAIAKINERCNIQCVICEGNTICGRNQKCEKPKSKKCENCTKDKDCESALKCIQDNTGTKKCTTIANYKERCNEKCVKCTNGLICDRKGICTKPKLEKCSRCEKDDNCKQGLRCGIDSSGKRVCSSKLQPLSKCGNKCESCPETHTCSRLKKKCVERSIKCAHCFEDYDCLPGLICKRFPDGDGRGKCASPMGVGKKCDDPCWACAKGLVCNGRYCAKN